MRILLPRLVGRGAINLDEGHACRRYIETVVDPTCVGLGVKFPGLLGLGRVKTQTASAAHFNTLISMLLAQASSSELAWHPGSVRHELLFE
jgi:hypothetical protein